MNENIVCHEKKINQYAEEDLDEMIGTCMEVVSNQHADIGLDEVIEVAPFEMMCLILEFEIFRWIAAIVILKGP